MNSTHDVISALLDNEPFDPEELLTALSESSGRALLIDLVALRRIVQPSDPAPPMHQIRPVERRAWTMIAAAAAVLIALAGGYIAGSRQIIETSAGAPPATRIVQAMPFTPGGNQ
jgi:hypothetical protein